ncbi:MAG: SDR family NAD(P)-dependent oxidoreductase [Actinobacteria bacterium]|nr:MAG: SDR family NAD(P)-dependent oxidoreductase [Actinomycetota bacterium]
MDELRFDGRAVVITGAGRGIGRSHALLLAARGAQVVVADFGAELDGTGTSRAPAEDVVKEIEANGGEAVACYASVAEEEGAAAIVECALERFGRLDAVINNAGISDKHLFGDLSSEQFRRMMAVHFFGTVHVTKAAWPHFVSAQYGRVVNTTSEAVLGAQDNLTSYGSAKGAIWAFTRNLAAEGVAFGIRVNAVAPRALTRMSAAGQTADGGTGTSDQISPVLARMKPELVAPAAAYLAHESCPLTGEVLIAGGGDVMRLTPVVTMGISKETMTMEDIAENIDAILSIDDAKVAPIGTYAR